MPALTFTFAVVASVAVLFALSRAWRVRELEAMDLQWSNDFSRAVDDMTHLARILHHADRDRSEPIIDFEARQIIDRCRKRFEGARRMVGGLGFDPGEEF